MTVSIESVVNRVFLMYPETLLSSIHILYLLSCTMIYIEMYWSKTENCTCQNKIVRKYCANDIAVTNVMNGAQ